MTGKQFILIAAGALALSIAFFAAGNTAGYKQGYIAGTCETYDTVLTGFNVPRVPGNYPLDCPQAKGIG